MIPIVSGVDVDHAEEIAFGVLEHHEVLALFGGPGEAFGPQLEEALYLYLLVVGIEIEMQPVLSHPRLGHLGDRNVDVGTLGILEDHEIHIPVALFVTEGVAPERGHPLEVVAIDDNGPNLQSKHPPPCVTRGSSSYWLR